jgi:hypothetical protein
MREDTQSYTSDTEERNKSRIADEIHESQERTASLIANAFGSLRTHILEAENRLDARFDSIDAQLDIHADMIRTALSAASRFSKFTETGNGVGSPP